MKCLKNRLNLLTGLFVIFIGLTISLAVTRAFSPAAAIACGETICDAIGVSGEQDTHTFSATSGEIINVSVASTSSNFCPAIKVIGPLGETVKDTFPFCNTRTGNIKLTASGVFTIVIYARDLGQTGSYCVNLAVTSGRCAPPISCGQTIGSSISPPSEMKVYKFNATAGEMVNISATGTSGNVCPAIELISPTGVTLTNTFPFCNTRTGNITLPIDGQYVFVIYGRDIGQVGNFNYSLTFTSGRCATPISCGQTINTTISPAPEIGVYSFCGKMGGTVDISAFSTSGNLCPAIELISPTGASLKNTFPFCNTRTGNTTLPVDGTYKIAISGRDIGQTGAANVNLTCTGNVCSCTYSFVFPLQPFPAGGGSGSVQVSTQSNCSWTATSEVNWIIISPPGSGTGNGTVNFTVAPNTSANSRTGTIRIGGSSVPISQSGASGREVKADQVSAGRGSTVSVPINLVSQGDENALGFSVTFDPNVLSNPQAAPGSDATGGSFNVNPIQTGQGRLGLALSLPAGQRFTAGTRQIAVVTFNVSSTTSATSTSIGFGDQPILREISGVTANPLPAVYTAGVATITTGYEADVAPRPNGGNDGTVTVTDWVQCGRFVAGLDTANIGGEFQRADDAPKETKGDGKLSTTDWVQCGRYAAGLDPVTSAAGPTAPLPSAQTAAFSRVQDESGATASRTVRALNTSIERGRRGAVTVELNAQGNENALGLSLNFNPTQLQFVSAALSSGSTGATINVNANQAGSGRVGLALALPAGQVMGAGLRPIIAVTFEALSGGGGESATIGFGDQPISREVSDANANRLPADYVPGTVSFSSCIATPLPDHWKGEYYANKDLNGAPAMIRDDGVGPIDFEWKDGSPSAACGIKNDAFSGRWTGIFNFNAGVHKFFVTGDDGVRLYVDNKLWISQWKDQSATSYSAEVPLTAGAHTIVLEYYENGGLATAKLSWESATCLASVSADHWKGEYFQGKNLSGAPSMVRDDGGGFLGFDWGAGSPGPSCGIGVDDFSIRWTTKANFAAGGVYRFTVTGDDGVRLYVDDRLELDKWFNQSATNYTADVFLTVGEHTIKLEYFENGGLATAKLSWGLFRVPKVEITEAPAYGSFDQLKGRVQGVNPEDYQIAVYIFVPRRWWTKPYLDQPLTPIQSDGSWIAQIATGGVDQLSTIIRAYLVPNGYSPPLIVGEPSLPDELEKNSVAKAEITRGALAVNHSEPTKCAEKDNIDLRFAGKVVSYTISATPSTNPIEPDSCAADFSDCQFQAGGYPFPPGVFKIYDDGETVVEAVRGSLWWRPQGMTAGVENGTPVSDIHYIRLYRRIAGTSEYPQYLVVYADSNLRLIPHPPIGARSRCFGSSVIVGPVKFSERPLAEIASITFIPGSKALEVKYKEGGSASILTQEVNRDRARVQVVVDYPIDVLPFAAFRSMYVADGNADVDRVKWVDVFGLTHDDPILGFTGGQGTDWLFYRGIRSRHNTSAPDIRIRLESRP